MNQIEAVFLSRSDDLQKKRSSPKLKRFLEKLGDLQKKGLLRPNLGDIQKKKKSEKKNSTFLVQITAIPSQLLLANPIGGGVFLILEQKSVPKALKTWYFAYFSGQLGVMPPPGYSTESIPTNNFKSASRHLKDCGMVKVVLFYYTDPKI